MAVIPDITLNGVNYMLFPGSEATATVNNPAGLRAAGGNRYRDFGAWSEAEFNDFSLGYGQKSMESKGFLVSDTDTLHGGIRNGPDAAQELLTPNWEPFYPFKNPYTGTDLRLKNARRLWSYLFPEMPVTFCNAWGIDFMAAGSTLYYRNTTTRRWVSVKFTSVNGGVCPAPIMDMAFYGGLLCISFGPAYYSAGEAPTDPYGDWYTIYGFVLTGHDASTGAPLVARSPGGAVGSGNRAEIRGTYVLEVYNGALYALNYNSIYVIVNSGQDAEDWGYERFVLPTVSAKEELATELPDWTMYKDPNGPEVMTGLVCLMGSDSQPMFYASTSSQLYHFRQTPNLDQAMWFTVLKWPGTHYLNGRGAIHHAGDSYFPVDGNILRVTPTGQLVWVGMQEAPVYPAFTYRRHVSLATSQSTLLSTVNQRVADRESTASQTLHNPLFDVRAYALSGQGWHPIDDGKGLAWNGTATPPAYVPVDPDPYKSSSIFYSARTRNVFYARVNIVGNTDNLLVAEVPWFEGNSQIQLGIGPATPYAYTDTSTIIFPNFDAGVPMLNKDFNGIEIHGECVGDSTYIDVYVAFNMKMIGCGAEVNFHKDVTWKLLDTIRSEGEFEVHIDCSRAGFPLPAKAMALKLVLHGTSTESPVITDIKYEYWVNIKDYFRFSYALTLPWDCLTDRCGVEIEGYEQADYDTYIRAAVCAEKPILLTDLDGKRYYVRVESASRRFSKLHVKDGKRAQDIAWSIILVQVCPTSLCEAGLTTPVIEDAETTP